MVRLAEHGSGSFQDKRSAAPSQSRVCSTADKAGAISYNPVSGSEQQGV